MSLEDAPNFRSLYPSCATCKHSACFGDYCEKYAFAVGDGADRICDSWEDYKK